jgi:hypothetical protein
MRAWGPGGGRPCNPGLHLRVSADSWHSALPGAGPATALSSIDVQMLQHTVYTCEHGLPCTRPLPPPPGCNKSTPHFPNANPTCCTTIICAAASMINLTGLAPGDCPAQPSLSNLDPETGRADSPHSGATVPHLRCARLRPTSLSAGVLCGGARCVHIRGVHIGSSHMLGLQRNGWRARVHVLFHG